MDVLINLRDDGVKIINVGLIDSTSQELRFCAGSNSAADRMLACRYPVPDMVRENVSLGWK